MTNILGATLYFSKVGVFWFVATEPNQTRLVSLLSPFDIDAADPKLVAASRDHSDAWPEVQRLDPALAGYAFDYFPRGRVEFFRPTRRWVLSVDPKLDRKAFVSYLINNWSLPAGHTTVEVNPAYVSAFPVREIETR